MLVKYLCCITNLVGIPYYTRLWIEETVDGVVKVSSKAYGMDNAKALMEEIITKKTVSIGTTANSVV